MKRLLTFALLLSSLGCAVMQRVVPRLAPAPEIVAAKVAKTQFTARTDFEVVQLPQPIPDLGNSIGANKKIIDPDFKSTYVRVTDCNTDPKFPCFSYVPPGGGSAMANPFSADAKLIAVADQGQRIHMMAFDPVNLQVGKQLWTGPGSAFFSRTLQNVMWNLNGTVLSKVVTTSKTVQVRKVQDYAKALPKHFDVLWHGDAGCSTSDTICAAAFSEGIQGTGFYIVVWQQNKGYRVYNTMTGQVSGQWGELGTVSIPDRYAIHQIKLSFLGDTLIITHANASCPDCDALPYIWNIATLNINLCRQFCTGHWAPGYKTLLTNSGKGSNGVGQFQSRLFTNSLVPNAIVTTVPPNLVSPFDTHLSWNGDNDTDTAPFVVSSTDLGVTQVYTFPWLNELLVVDPETGLVHREGHTEATGKSSIFPCAQAIAPSSNKDLIMFSTDWRDTFANGTTPRCDVVIVRAH